MTSAVQSVAKIWYGNKFLVNLYLLIVECTVIISTYPGFHPGFVGIYNIFLGVKDSSKVLY
jgi:hypothetical protein